MTVPQPNPRPDPREVLASRVPDAIVEDHLERRIRKPVDLLRCIVSCIEVTALALAGVAASATTIGVETDIVGASNRLPHSLLKAAPPLALLALALLPAALTVSLLVHRQPRRLAEAAATGILAIAATVAADAVLRHSAFTVLYDATVVFLVLLCWLVIETQGGSDLGLAERLLLSTDTCWPFVVAIALRRTTQAGGRSGVAEVMENLAE